MNETREITFKLRKTFFLLDKLASKLLKEELSIGTSQFRMLMAINNHKSISQKDIAKYWEMTEAAVSRQIDSLITKKLIERKENEKNRSKNSLTLTVVGQKYLSKGFSTIDRNFEQLYKVMNKTQRTAVNEGLGKVLDKLCRQEGSKK